MPEFPTAEQFIRELRLHSGPYAEYALRARLKYINIRSNQDREIRAFYIKLADMISRQIRDVLPRNSSETVRISQLIEIEKSLREFGERLNVGLTEMLRGYIESGVSAGVEYSRSIATSYLTQTGMTRVPIDALMTRVNRQAVEAIYARTHDDGLHLSDRIWNTAQHARDSVKNIITEAVATGQDAVKVARAIEGYVREDALTLTHHFPNMMERMAGRVPNTLSYEALRLARTEMTAAFGEGTILSSRATPSYQGMKWQLSSSHPKYDICDHLATAEFGLGIGVYPTGSEPRYPAHPNCLCNLIPIHTAPDEMVDQLLEWERNPQSQPHIEEWYRTYSAAIVA